MSRNQPAKNSKRSAVREESQPVLIRLSDVEAESVEWLWPNRIALGKLTMLVGDPGLGKSFITCDLAARVSVGTAWPDDEQSKAPCGGVVILNCEDDLADTIRPRLDRHAADVSRIVALSAVRVEEGRSKVRQFDLARDIAELEKAIVAVGECKLVVIDPVTAYLGVDADSHKNADVRALLAPLADLAARRNVAVVLVSHLNKSNGRAIYRTMGSIGFVAAARAAWCVTKDNDKPSRRLLLPIKNNLGVDQYGLAYSIVDSKVAWEPEPVTISADAALSDEPERRGPDPVERDSAIEYLQEALANGARPASELEEEATKGHDIAKRTLARAKKDLGIVSFRKKTPGPWYWQLPPAANVTKDSGNLGTLGLNEANRGTKPNGNSKAAN